MRPIATVLLLCAAGLLCGCWRKDACIESQAAAASLNATLAKHWPGALLEPVHDIKLLKATASPFRGIFKAPWAEYTLTYSVRIGDHSGILQSEVTKPQFLSLHIDSLALQDDKTSVSQSLTAWGERIAQGRQLLYGRGLCDAKFIRAESITVILFDRAMQGNKITGLLYETTMRKTGKKEWICIHCRACSIRKEIELEDIIVLAPARLTSASPDGFSLLGTRLGSL